jgi:DNA-binding CsgD family transcriptional regulator
LLEALDKISTAAILVDGAGRPLLMNSTAQRILSRRDGLSSIRGGLCANSTLETLALQKLVSASARPATDNGASAGGAMRLSRLSTSQPLHVVVSRLRGSRGHRLDEQARAVVFVHDPDEEHEISCERLATLHCLTNAEARIGAMLASGRSVREISTQLKVSGHTVRTHIKHLLAKTDTNGQIQLVRLIIRSLSLVSESPI